MDTVEPGRGVRAVFIDGEFKSGGSTILGADCKSSIAVLLEVLRVLEEDDLPHGPLEIVFTVCEEIGLLGAKNLDYGLLNARMGYSLDASDIDGIVVQAPTANRLEFKVFGKDAHAGASPEKGINAIQIASKAIAGLQLGRIDHETTSNIGVIKGGLATNIVPSQVKVEGEVRSHDKNKLARNTEKIVTAFQKAVEECKAGNEAESLPFLEHVVKLDFPGTHIDEDDQVVRIAKKAAARLGRSMKTKISGGGADANIFCSKGIKTGVLGVGMRDMHTVRESIRLDDMKSAAELVLEIIDVHAKEITR
jgi:tripeptide aminopeptidase